MAPQVAPEQPQPQGPQATKLTEQSPANNRIDPNPLAAPMPPIEKVRGAQYPKPEAPAGEKLEYLKRQIQITEAEHLANSKQLAYHMLLANGKQHISWSNRSRRWEETPLIENETRVTLNMIRPILRARTNRLLPKNFDWQVTPDSNDYDARDNAKVAERFLNAMRERTALLKQTDIALELAYCGGVAFLKSFWNPTIGSPRPAQLAFVEPVPQPIMGPDGQPLTDPHTGQPAQQLVPQPVMHYVDENGQPVPDDNPDAAYWFRPGDTDIAIRTLFTVRWNHDALGFSPADGLRFVIDQEAIPTAVAKERYPEFADKITTSSDASITLTYQRMAALSSLRTPDRSTPTIAAMAKPEEYTVVTEYWELPSEYFKNGRLIVFVGDCEVGDGEFPDGLFPYEPIFDEPVPLSPRGRGVVTDMVAPQQIVNEVYASMVAAMRLQGLGQWIGPNVPGMPDIISSQHGQMVRVPLKALQGRSIRDVIMPLEHAQVPTDRERILQLAQETLYQVGAFHEVSRGQVPPGVDSGVAVRALAEREDGQIMRAKTALQSALVNVGRAQLKIAKARYQPGDERWLPVDRPDLGYQIESVDGAKLPDPERLLVTVSGFSPRTQEELRADIKEAMLNGWLTPAQGLKALDLGRGIETAFSSEQRHYAKARMQNLWIEQGQVQVVPVPGPDGQPLVDPNTGQPVTQCIGPDGDPLMLPTIDDHAIHMSVLEEIILDLTKPLQVRHLALQVYAEHEQKLFTPVAPPAPEPDSSPSAPSDQSGTPTAPGGPPQHGP